MSDNATATPTSEPTIDEFRAEVTTFLDANYEPKPTATEFVWGDGDDDVALFEELDPETEAQQLVEAKAHLAARDQANLAWITGPIELGGRGLHRSYDAAYRSLEGGYKVPNMSFFGIGFGMVAPTILAHATESVKAKVLPAMYRGDLVGCQLFSEPGAGSDLAGLQMRADRDGDEWLLNGQKVWTSGAHYSDVGEVICRTDPDLPKHRGLTGFVVDMHAPGVEVRPLRQMTGGAAFCEVFFENVRVPDDNRLGDVNQGWTVALTTLMNERASIGGGGGGGGGLSSSSRLIQMMQHFGVTDDAVKRDELARLYTGFQVARMTSQRAMAKVRAGGLPGPEMSIGKLALTANLTATAEFVASVLGPRLIADTGEWGTYAWSKFVCGTPGMRIAGGSDETLRNIVGERVLGLPKEPGIDTTSAFRELRKN